MKITVRLGEPFWRVMGRQETTVGVAPGQTAAHAVNALLKRYPALAAEFGHEDVQLLLIINNETACSDTPLADGATLQILWPLSGG